MMIEKKYDDQTETFEDPFGFVDYGIFRLIDTLDFRKSSSEASHLILYCFASKG